MPLPRLGVCTATGQVASSSRNIRSNWDGDPAFGDECSERAWLGYYSCKSIEDKKSYVLRLKNALSGRAWRLMHTRQELAISKLVKDVGNKPKETVEVFIAVVRGAYEKVAPLRKREAFNNFFLKGTSYGNEAIQDFIARREADHEKLTNLSPSTTPSEDLPTYFLLELSNIDEDTHRRILGMCDNEYSWERITNTMLIQLDRHEAAPRGDARGGPK